MYNFKYYLNNSQIFYDNIKELEYRGYYIILSILNTFIVSYYYINQIIFVITKYLLCNMESQRFIFTKITEVFYTYIQFSLITSLFITIPFILLNFWFFLIPGLYQYERFYLNCFFFLIFLLFNFSFIISYNYIIPTVLKFFLYFENNNIYYPLHFEAKINDYLFPIYLFLFNLMICFQFPSLIIFFVFFDIINYEYLIIYRKYFYLLFFLLSGLIAPPDFYSQLILFIILVFFFEIFLFFIIFFKNLFFTVS